MVIDVAAVRSETRGSAHVAHFDHAGSSLMPRTVVDTVVAHLRREEEIGGYAAAEEAAGPGQLVYASLARLVGGSPEEMAVMESGTSAWSAAVGRLRLRGSRILIAHTEYRANMLALRVMARRHGMALVVLRDDGAGRVDLDHLDRELQRGGVALVALTHVPMAGGRVQPATAVGRRCQAAGVLFVLDACQSVGQLPLDVRQLGCDVLVGTGRKFLRGPRGTAFVYVRSGLLEPVEGPGDAAVRVRRNGARNLESWEHGVAARLGLGRAVEYALDLGMEAIHERVLALAGALSDRLRGDPAVTVHHAGPVECGTVLFSLRGRSASEVREDLAAQAIHVSTTPLLPPDASTALDPETARAALAVRASVHYLTTQDEVDRLVLALRRTAQAGSARTKA